MPDKKEKVININIPEELHRELRIKAAEKGSTIKDEVITAIQKHVTEVKAAVALTEVSKPNIIKQELKEYRD